MIDLFAREEQVLENAISHIEQNGEADTCSMEQYRNLVKEYARILKQLRRVTKVSDKTAVELNQDKIKLLSKVHIDELTGIYNRRFFDEELIKVFNYCREKDSGMGVLMLDVDYFKRYNDTYGHGAGDDCLRVIAKTIQEEAEEANGFAARYGGEEFVAVVKDVSCCELKVLGEGILEAVRELKIPHEKNGERKCVTISIGGYCEVVSDKSLCCEFVKNADIALYQSKQTGRDKYTLYQKED